jgi:predicted NAD/FAD-binding protein
MENLNIAVVGSGIAGLSAAWLLSKRHRVTLYEAENHIGGHANTVDVDTSDGRIAVDTGFIVYNERNYPNLTALFEHLGVATEPTEMSFALSLDGGAYEYAASGAQGFFGQRRNLARPGHWRLMMDISRFFRTARARVKCFPSDVTLGTFLTQEGYSNAFVQDHIIPMGAAIWSTAMNGMLAFPARSFIDFYANHGMLQFRERPDWRTVTGGSRKYVELLIADGGFEVHRNNSARRVVRHTNYIHITDERGVVRPFDHVVIATHADQAIRLLDEPDPLEAKLLGAFEYQTNWAVLHRDRRWMPRRKKLWSSWNYLKRRKGFEDDLCVTYWMNRLQNLKTNTNLFLTLNPTAQIHPKAIEAVFDYDHPVFSASAIEAQKSLWAIQGTQRTWFCGSYFGYGFHEDGVQSGLAVAEQLGQLRRPWQVIGESDRIHLPDPAAVEAAE